MRSFHVQLSKNNGASPIHGRQTPFFVSRDDILPFVQRVTPLF